MEVTITVDLKKVTKEIDGAKRQVLFAAAKTLTQIAKQTEAATRETMRREFDRPTPWTLNSLRTLPATKTKLEATVKLKDDAAKSLTAAKALKHQVEGGQRANKKSEAALWRIGLLASSEMTVPGEAAKLDQYGNMSKAQINQILSWFQAFGEQGYKANSTAATRAKKAKGTRNKRGKRFYFKRDRPGRGIYEATATSWGSAIKPVLMFVRKGTYTQRIDIEQIARKQMLGFQRTFDANFAAAMATAR